MSDFIKLAEAPEWCISYPTCSACQVDLELDGSWTCPVCGTSWPEGASDGDRGTLYEDRFAGATLEGPVLDHLQAADEGWYRTRLSTHRAMPDLVPAPMLPAHRREAQ